MLSLPSGYLRWIHRSVVVSVLRVVPRRHLQQCCGSCLLHAMPRGTLRCCARAVVVAVLGRVNVRGQCDIRDGVLRRCYVCCGVNDMPALLARLLRQQHRVSMRVLAVSVWHVWVDVWTDAAVVQWPVQCRTRILLRCRCGGGHWHPLSPWLVQWRQWRVGVHAMPRRHVR